MALVLSATKRAVIPTALAAGFASLLVLSAGGAHALDFAPRPGAAQPPSGARGHNSSCQAAVLAVRAAREHLERERGEARRAIALAPTGHERWEQMIEGRREIAQARDAWEHAARRVQHACDPACQASVRAVRVAQEELDRERAEAARAVRAASPGPDRVEQVTESRQEVARARAARDNAAARAQRECAI